MSTVLHDARFSVGQVFSLSFSVFFSNIVPFMILGFLLFLPSLLISLFFPEFVVGATGQLGTILFPILEFILQILLMATLIYGTVSQLRGNRRPFTDSLTNSIGLVPPVFLISILLGIGLGVGFVLLVVPGLILLTVWWVTIPAAVVERPGIFRSFSRSAELTKGHRWAIFAIVVLVFLASFAIEFVLLSALVPGGMGVFGGNVPYLSYADLNPYLIGSWIVGVITAAFQAVLAGVSYTLLRTEKEGTDINQIAAVFD